MQSEKASMSAPVHAVVHTPGPWGAVRSLTCGHLRAAHNYQVDPRDEWTDADLKLISAAPDLLEALQKFVAWHDADHESMKGWEVQEMYDQAIDAAKSALSKVM